MTTTHQIRPLLVFAVILVFVWAVLTVTSDAAILPAPPAGNSEADETSGSHKSLSFAGATVMAKSMKHKKDYTTLCLSIPEKMAAVADRMAEDGEEPWSDHESRVLMARTLIRETASLIAKTLRMDEDDVREALAAIDAEAKAAEAAILDVDDEPVADAS